MKNKKYFLVPAAVVTILMMINPSANAQIQISWPQPPPYGHSVNVNIDTSISTAGLNLGISGGAQTWNFNQTIDLWTADYQTNTVAGTPWAASFPTAEWVDRVWQYVPAFLSVPAGIEEIYTYRMLNGSWIEEIGMATEGATILGSPFIYDTPSRVYPNPLTASSPPWIEDRYFEAALGLSLNTGSLRDSSIVSVDGWGTLTIPAGSYDCIKIKRDEYRFIESLFYDDTLHTYSYVWLTHNFDLLLWVTADASEGLDFDTSLYTILSTNVTAVDCDPDCQESIVPHELSLGQNYPNPFNPTTSIRYVLPQPARVELKIYGILGQEIAILESSHKPAGEHFAVWNGEDMKGNKLPGGIYFYQLRAIPVSGQEAIVQTRKMILSK